MYSVVAVALCVTDQSSSVIQQSHVNKKHLCACNPHPAIFDFVKYLWGERVPRGRPGLLRNILSHPLPVGLVGRNVTLLEFDLIGRQEAHHILLLLFNLRVGEMREGDRQEVVS